MSRASDLPENEIDDDKRPLVTVFSLNKFDAGFLRGLDKIEISQEL
jgi:hypothetical protein